MIAFLCVIIDDLDVNRSRARPDKADAVLVVGPNRMLPSSIASQGFEPIARGHAELIEIDDGIQHGQLIECLLPKRRRQ
jgi:hypothetical protein